MPKPIEQPTVVPLDLLLALEAIDADRDGQKLWRKLIAVETFAAHIRDDAVAEVLRGMPDRAAKH